MNIQVNCSKQTGVLPHFWAATGFVPAELLANGDMRQNMAHVGALPHGGLKYVRVLYLLDLAGAEGLDGPKPWYSFSPLDDALDMLISNGLKPLFVLMGNPGGFFTDFSDDAQVRAWKGLVRAVAEHVINRYGADEVVTWYFETWNEPDCGRWWHQWPDNIPSFLNYYDACSEGLKEADPALLLGGPGTCRTLSDIFKAFLEHCDKGRNYFTDETDDSGETGVRLDFISIHENGARASEEDAVPDTRGICEGEVQVFEYIRDHHPNLAGLPFMNDECSPHIGWSDEHLWRAGAYYPALTARMINQHLHVLVDDQACRYALLASHHGFLGRWGQRTLLARFGDEAELGRNQFELIKKPILGVYALLAQLGKTRLRVSGCEGAWADVGAIATRLADEQVAVLVYHCGDRLDAGGSEEIRIKLHDLPFGEGMLCHYRIDGQYDNPYALWQEMGSPANPSGEQFARLRERQEPPLLEPPREVKAKDGQVTVEFELPQPGVSLVLLTRRPEEPPGEVTGLKGAWYPGLGGRTQIMLSWTGLDSRAVRSYEVLYAQGPEGPFRRISAPGLICSAFLHSPVPPQDAAYKIRVVDYWGRTGPAADLTMPWVDPAETRQDP